MLDTRPLSDVCFANISSQTVTSFFPSSLSPFFLNLFGDQELLMMKSIPILIDTCIVLRNLHYVKVKVRHTSSMLLLAKV
jgi:hypothetical protein